MDFLGIRNLTTIHEIVTNLKEQKHISLDMMKINLKDAKTYQLLSFGNTLGVFQLESSGITSYLQMIQPKKFDVISDVLAYYSQGENQHIIGGGGGRGGGGGGRDFSVEFYADSSSDWWI